MPNRYADVSGIGTGQSNTASSVVTPLNQLDAAIVALADGDTGFNQINVGTASELTIEDGAITITGSHHTIDTEEDASSDTLTTINGGSEGDILYLRLANAARTVTLEHGTDNLYLAGEDDYDLTDANKTVVLFHNGTGWTDKNWTNDAGTVLEAILGWTELASAAASVSISNIPATYKTLILRVAVRSAYASDLDNLLVLFNDDTTAANYQGSLAQLQSNTVTTYDNNTSFAGLYGGQLPTSTATSGYMGISDIVIYNVTSDRFKSLVFNGFAIYGTTPSMAAFIGGGLWLNTASLINKITLQTSSGENLAADTAYALYGVL